jgi:hypothetical protein
MSECYVGVDLDAYAERSVGSLTGGPSEGPISGNLACSSADEFCFGQT